MSDSDAAQWLRDKNVRGWFLEDYGSAGAGLVAVFSPLHADGTCRGLSLNELQTATAVFQAASNAAPDDENLQGIFKLVASAKRAVNDIGLKICGARLKNGQVEETVATPADRFWPWFSEIFQKYRQGSFDF